MAMFYTEVTPVLDTSAYIAGDCLSDVVTVNTGASAARPVQLVTLSVLDKDDQGAAFDVLFFKASPTVASAKNAAMSVTDAEMDKFVGVARVASGDYIDVGNNRVATVQCTNLSMTAGAGGALYAVLVSQGTGTYTASGLILKLSFATEG